VSNHEPVVLLPPAPQPEAPGSAQPPIDWSPLALAFGSDRTVLTPDVSPSPDRTVVLEEPALAALAAMSGAGLEMAALCGIGYGAMVAMLVAADFGDRVSSMVLSTARTPESTAVLSLHRGVRNLLPAMTVQRLGWRPDQVVELLDQVRPLDYRAFGDRIGVPTLVLVGERDVANFGPSQAAARIVPGATLQVVPGASAGWQRREPERFAALAAEFVDSHSRRWGR
jgi:pimeloyl-ACP methyl ester carboxylesterase